MLPFIVILTDPSTGNSTFQCGFQRTGMSSPMVFSTHSLKYVV